MAVGVAGLMKRQEEQQRQQGEQVSEAFADLQKLMGAAEEMVGLAEKFR